MAKGSRQETEAMPEQGFWAPDALPYLEIRTTRNSSRAYANHFHASLSIGLVFQGRTRFFCDGVVYEAAEGDIVVIGPGQVHSCNPVDGEPRGYHMLHLEASWCLERMSGEEPVEVSGVVPGEGTIVAHRNSVRDAWLYQRLMCLVPALCRGDAAAGQDFAFAVEELFRQCCSMGNAAQTASPLLRIRKELRDGCEPPVSVASLAGRAGFGREGFIRAFRRSAGLPPGAYRQCARLEQGRRLLRQGFSIAEAAQTAGFTDQSHFHRMFVKYYCVTPGCYRKNKSLLYKK